MAPAGGAARPTPFCSVPALFSINPVARLVPGVSVAGDGTSRWQRLSWFFHLFLFLLGQAALLRCGAEQRREPGRTRCGVLAACWSRWRIHFLARKQPQGKRQNPPVGSGQGQSSGLGPAGAGPGDPTACPTPPPASRFISTMLVKRFAWPERARSHASTGTSTHRTVPDAPGTPTRPSPCACSSETMLGVTLAPASPLPAPWNGGGDEPRSRRGRAVPCALQQRPRHGGGGAERGSASRAAAHGAPVMRSCGTRRTHTT